MDNSTELKKIKLIAQILHYPASSNDLKQKGILIKQEHHDESLHIVLDQEEQVYFPIPAGHQFKFWTNILMHFLQNTYSVYAPILV